MSEEQQPFRDAQAHLTNRDNVAIALFGKPGAFALVVGNIAPDMIRGATECLRLDIEEAFPGEVESVKAAPGSVAGRWDITAMLTTQDHEAVMRFIREDLEGSENQAVKH